MIDGLSGHFCGYFQHVGVFSARGVIAIHSREFGHIKVILTIKLQRHLHVGDRQSVQTASLEFFCPPIVNVGTDRQEVRACSNNKYDAHYNCHRRRSLC